MPPKGQSSRARAVPPATSRLGKKRRLVADQISVPDDVVEEITKRVTASITTLIKEVVNARSSDLDNQGSIDKSNVQASPQITISDNSATVNSQLSVLPEATEANKGKGQTGFVSTAVPIEALVSDQIKSKIWSNQCIDFVKLLSKEKQKKGKFSLQVENSDSQGKLTIHQVENDAEDKSSVCSMHDWITAWNRYAAIYCIKYPEQQSKLAKHLEAVRDIADAKGNWKYYDAEFKQLVSQGQVAWGDVHMELYVNARLKTDLLTKVSSEDAPLGPIPKGACFNYHAGKQCRAGLSCRFQHRCYNCGSNHPFKHCNKQTQQPFRFLRKFHTQANNNKESTNLPNKKMTKVQQFRELATWTEQTSSRDTSPSAFSILIGVKGKLPILDISLEIILISDPYNIW